MNALERYLRQATRGLPRREARKVREELRSSILERAAEQQIAGHREAEALALALREFGDPAPLAVGMRRVHLWPQMGLLGTAMGALLLTAFLVWPPALAQSVTVTTTGLLARCTPSGPPADARTCTGDRRFWIEVASLTDQLARQGATLTPVQRSFPGPPDPSSPASSLFEDGLRVSWNEPDGRPGSFDLLLTNRRGEAFMAWMRRRDGAQGSPLWNRPDETIIKRDGRTFLDGDFMTEMLRQSLNLPLRIARPLDAPILHLGRLRLELGQPGQGSHLSRLMEAATVRVLAQQYGVAAFYGANLLPALDDAVPRTQGYGQQVRVKGQPDELYAVLRPISGPGTNGLGFDLATVDQGGWLRFRSKPASVAYTGDVRALAASGEGKAKVALLRFGQVVTFPRSPSAVIKHQVEIPAW